MRVIMSCALKLARVPSGPKEQLRKFPCGSTMSTSLLIELTRTNQQLSAFAPSAFSPRDWDGLGMGPHGGNSGNWKVME